MKEDTSEKRKQNPNPSPHSATQSNLIHNSAKVALSLCNRLARVEEKNLECDIQDEWKKKDDR